MDGVGDLQTTVALIVVFLFSFCLAYWWRSSSRCDSKFRHSPWSVPNYFRKTTYVEYPVYSLCAGNLSQNVTTSRLAAEFSQTTRGADVCGSTAPLHGGSSSQIFARDTIGAKLDQSGKVMQHAKEKSVIVSSGGGGGVSYGIPNLMETFVLGSPERLQESHSMASQTGWLSSKGKTSASLESYLELHPEARTWQNQYDCAGKAFLSLTNLHSTLQADVYDSLDFNEKLGLFVATTGKKCKVFCLTSAVAGVQELYGWRTIDSASKRSQDCVTWSTNGHFIATSTDDGSCTVWNFKEYVQQSAETTCPPIVDDKQIGTHYQPRASRAGNSGTAPPSRHQELPVNRYSAPSHSANTPYANSAYLPEAARLGPPQHIASGMTLGAATGEASSLHSYAVLSTADTLESSIRSNKAPLSAPSQPPEMAKLENVSTKGGNYQLHFSPDDRCVLAVGRDKKLRLIGFTDEPRQISPPPPFAPSFGACSSSSDGTLTPTVDDVGMQVISEFEIRDPHASSAVLAPRTALFWEAPSPTRDAKPETTDSVPSTLKYDIVVTSHRQQTSFVQLWRVCVQRDAVKNSQNGMSWDMSNVRVEWKLLSSLVEKRCYMLSATALSENRELLAAASNTQLYLYKRSVSGLTRLVKTKRSNCDGDMPASACTFLNSDTQLVVAATDSTITVFDVKKTIKYHKTSEKFARALRFLTGVVADGSVALFVGAVATGCVAIQNDGVLAARAVAGIG